MAAVKNQPISETGEIDRRHWLGRYTTFALFAGAGIPLFDACGNRIKKTQDGIRPIMGGRQNRALIQDGTNTSSLLYVEDKNIGNLGSGDFTVFFSGKISAGSNYCYIGKGDTGSGEWMFGFGSSSSHRFYANAGLISAASTLANSTGVPIYIAATRVGSTVELCIRGNWIASDTSASATLTESNHHLTIGGADYDGTTIDTARTLNGEIESLIVLVGVGGRRVVDHLAYDAESILKRRKRWIGQLVSAPSYTHPTLSNVTAAEITSSGFKPRVTYTF